MNEFLGLYPAWLEPGIGAGWVIGFIATIHVLFSHASVGAALVFAWLARRAVTANQPQHLDFIRKYGAFLLIFSYVLGSVTGPGIWFAATIANPRGISALIHNFVWLWATEWVFFLIEVAGVYLLVYLAGRVPIKTYLRYCTIFALSSVGTLLIIVGILSFMLWPGQDSWYQTGGVLSAFFGESMFAQLSARFFFMLTITGVVGGFAATKTADPAEKSYIARTLTGLGAVGAVLGTASLYWFASTLTSDATIVSATRMPESFAAMMWAALAVTLVYFALTAWRPSVMNLPLTVAATLVILGHSLREQGITEIYHKERTRWFVKSPAFSFAKIRGVDSYLSPEMKSTGEAIGYDNSLTRALYKSLQSSGMTVANYGTIFVTIADHDKQRALPLIRRFYNLGFNIEATKGTCEFLIYDSLRKGHVTYVINTIDVNQHSTRRDGYDIRRAAVENNVTIFTALETVSVLLDVLEEITLGVSTIDAQ